MKTLKICAVINSIVFLVLFFLVWFTQFWFFGSILIAFSGIFFVFCLIYFIEKRNKAILKLYSIILIVIFISIVLDSELFKSKVVFDAYLEDDLSGIELKLREDKTFEVISQSLLTEDVFSGEYELNNNKIIFKSKHYSNDYIPDTIVIQNDTVFIKFDSLGKPINDFATFFKIRKNELK